MTPYKFSENRVVLGITTFFWLTLAVLESQLEKCGTWDYPINVFFSFKYTSYLELCSSSFFGIISYFEKVWKMPLLLKRFWLIKIVQLPVLCVWAHILYAEGLKIIAFQKYRYLLECLLLIFVTWGQQYLLHGANNICYMGPQIFFTCVVLLFFKNVGLEVIIVIHIWKNLRSEFSEINLFICTVVLKVLGWEWK